MSESNMAMCIKDEICKLGLAHVRGAVWQVGHIFAGGYPNRYGGTMHEQVSELLCGACKAQHIKWHEMSKYLSHEWSAKHTENNG